MPVVVLEARFMRVLVRVTFVAVGMSVCHVFVIVTGMGVRMAGLGVLVLVVVRCLVAMVVTHTFISISLPLGVEPAVAR
jgi:hypothetical protein